MDMYQEYADLLNEEAMYEFSEVHFGRSMEFKHCCCGKLIDSCPDAYEHMSRGC